MLSCLILWFSCISKHTLEDMPLWSCPPELDGRGPHVRTQVCVCVSVCETECQRRQASCLVESGCASYNPGPGVATPQMFWMFLPPLCFWFLLVCLELGGLQAVHRGTFQGGLANSPWCPFRKTFTWRRGERRVCVPRLSFGPKEIEKATKKVQIRGRPMTKAGF